VHASPPRHDDAPEVRQRLQAQVTTHLDEVKQLERIQKLVVAQAGQVDQRLDQARQSLATLHVEPEIQPADHATAQASSLAAQQQAGEQQVSLLVWRHRNLGERKQQVAQMLKNAQAELAKARERLCASALPPAPILTPHETPHTSTPGSPAGPLVPHTRSESSDSVGSPRCLSSTSSGRQAAADMETLYEALPGGGSAVARLAERAERQSPRTLAGWLRRPSFKGAPKPLKGKRQAAFMQLVRDDVLKVAKQGGLSLEQAAKLMCEAVGSQALEVTFEVTLSQADKEYLLHSLDELLRELALAQA
jgi:hypothetical protein